MQTRTGRGGREGGKKGRVRREAWRLTGRQMRGKLVRMRETAVEPSREGNTQNKDGEEDKP
jgi:hypothetical protein